MLKRGGAIAAGVAVLVVIAIVVAARSAGPAASDTATQQAGHSQVVAAATLTAAPSAAPVNATAHRVYYLAADTVQWNFAPQGRNVIKDEPFGDEENVFVAAGPQRIGAINTMSQYRQYTDATFSTLIPRSAEDAYMGIVGPTIYAAVGDTIDVVFKNNTPYPASVHPHGVFYGKDAEGAPYNDGTSGGDKADDSVPTGSTHTYHWQVPERAGPGPMDPSSIIWMYHSHADEVKDTNSGLVGAMVISRAGQANADGTPKGVDRNVVVDFQIFDQNQSLYLDKEIAALKDGKHVDPESDEFVESNLKHSINGYLYGNMPLITMKTGQTVRWYVMAFGTEVDVHTPHWHGNTVVISGMRMDMTQLIAGSMITAEMKPDDPGIWLFHCHVNDHILAGMIGRYQVVSA